MSSVRSPLTVPGLLAGIMLTAVLLAPCGAASPAPERANAPTATSVATANRTVNLVVPRTASGTTIEAPTEGVATLRPPVGSSETGATTPSVAPRSSTPASSAPSPASALCPSPRSTPYPTVQPSAAPRAYVGRNHLWVPGIGIDLSIGGVWNPECTQDWSSAIPNLLVEWGCDAVLTEATTPYVYLLGHAAGVFAPLDAAYHAGLLVPGLRLSYAGPDGHVRTYVLTRVQRLLPSTYAPLTAGAAEGVDDAVARPAVMLQTCDGPASQWRILALFVAGAS